MKLLLSYRWLCPWLVLVFGAGLVGLVQAGDPPSAGSASEKIRKDMAKARADLQRRQAERRQASANKASTVNRSTSTASERGTPLQYRFKTGDKFAYRLEIEVGGEGNGRVERFTGTPHFTVMSDEPDGETRLLVIGKLTCTTSYGSDGEETPHPTRTVWMGSRLSLSPWGSMAGRDDYHDDRLPDFLVKSLGCRPSRLIFPGLPRSVPGLRSSSGTAHLSMTQTGGRLALPTFEMIRGTEVGSEQATPISGGLVQVDNVRSFRSDPRNPSDTEKKTQAELQFHSVMRFDPGRGVPLSTTATARCVLDDSRPSVVTVKVRRLEGEEFDRASKQAIVDWGELPAELDPIEFRRVRAERGRQPSLRSLAEVRPGMPVVHFRCNSNSGYKDVDRMCYMADVVELGDARPERVKIRYRGTEEVLMVYVSELSRPAP